MSGAARKHGVPGGYRPDIDGLRAVAVLLVLLYHFDFGVTGGFVGVDVFFVISGFLITGIIHRQALTNRFSFLDFYERRARRILPALMVVLTACTAAASVMLLPSDLERFGASLAATLTFVSNFFFWSQGSYFGPASDLAPLLHTWSLSVEEQFYLVMPPLYLLLQRFFPNRVPHVFALVTLVSLAGASYFVMYRAHEVFYWTPFRVWELAIGGCLAVAKLPEGPNPAVRSAAAALGIIMILAAGLMFDATTPFPGFSALLPCGGAALVIWAGSKRNAVCTKVLGNRPMILIGLISYSLYLWHWPIIAFARHHFVGEPVPLTARVILATGAVLLAYLTWKFVESPFRNRKAIPIRRAASWGLASLGAAAGVAVVMIISHGLPQRFPESVIAMDKERVRVPYRDECMNRRGKVSILDGCRLGIPGDPTVLVWGDSYAQAMMPALDSALREIGLAGVFIGRSGCPPLPGTSVSLRGRVNWKCSEFNDQAIVDVSSNPGIDTVLLSAAWNHYVDPETGYRLALVDGSKGEPLAVSFERLRKRLAGIAQIRRIVVVEQVPTYPWAVPYRMAVAKKRGEAMPVVPSSDHLADSKVARAAFGRQFEEGAFNVVRPVAWFCDDKRCNYANPHGLPYYFDHGHLNRRGADFVAPRLTSDLKKILDAVPAEASPRSGPSANAQH